MKNFLSERSCNRDPPTLSFDWSGFVVSVKRSKKNGEAGDHGQRCVVAVTVIPPLAALVATQASTSGLIAAIPRSPTTIPTPSSTVSLSDEDIQYHLDNWARWHRASYFGALRSLWYPGKASGKMGVSGSTSFDEMCDGVDEVTARALNAVIDDLPMVNRALLHHLYLQAVYRFPRLCSLEAAFAATLPLLRTGMIRKGIFA